MEYAADVRIELVKLVDGAAAVRVPQHTVAQDEIVGRVERRLVVAVVVGAVGVVQREELASRRHIVNLRECAASLSLRYITSIRHLYHYHRLSRS